MDGFKVDKKQRKEINKIKKRLSPNTSTAFENEISECLRAAEMTISKKWIVLRKKNPDADWLESQREGLYAQAVKELHADLEKKIRRYR